MADAESGSTVESSAMSSRRKEMMSDSADPAVSETRRERGRTERRDAGLAGPKQGSAPAVKEGAGRGEQGGAGHYWATALDRRERKREEAYAAWTVG